MSTCGPGTLGGAASLLLNKDALDFAGAMAEALQKIAAQKVVVSRIVTDQARLRENMKALKGSSEEKALIERYTSQLDQQENQLESLRKNIQDTEACGDKATDAFENRIDNLQLESTL